MSEAQVPSSNTKIYHIYSHSDVDGGIAAAIFGRFIEDTYGTHGWKVAIHPVSHGTSHKAHGGVHGGTHGEWSYQELLWPCAILDFSLHPQFLLDRFFRSGLEHAGLQDTDPATRPPCYWIDHHPTGANFSFLEKDNLAKFMPHVIGCWDTSALSTPGLMRTHRETLKIPQALIESYEEFIDLAEIVDGAQYATCEDSCDFTSPAVQLQSLFCPQNQLLDRTELYKKLAHQMMKSPSVSALFDSDPLFGGIVASEESYFKKQLQHYRKVTTMVGDVAYARFASKQEFSGFGRFIPYLLYPKAKYAVHILPQNDHAAHCTISCGVNPWSSTKDESRHIGRYFEAYFGGGGHAFVGGGRVRLKDYERIQGLMDFLNKN